ncbi:MAG: bifunctional hydroxymethylpyrimidine kinase/phosphomethylpyrimidine kinase [Myxococcota bacterium]|jgi:hydroxymethylpyrimidine/phosphomethylpyrimidine kinase
MRVALSIAGFDPSGGAGVLADMRAFASFGVYGMAVVTAITAQNSTGVHMAHPLSRLHILHQLEDIFSDFTVSAVKIGMLRSRTAALTVARFLRTCEGQPPIVLDPVLVSSSGRLLLDPVALRAVKHELLHQCSLVTPNLREASVLSGRPVETVEDMERAAMVIRQYGPGAVLVKGGHLKSAATDVFFDGDRFLRLKGKRSRLDVHGTGCHLSAAIAAHLAVGMPMDKSVESAKVFMEKMFARRTFKPGAGMHYFY